MNIKTGTKNVICIDFHFARAQSLAFLLSCLNSFQFCPSVFLYLISVVPAIWLLELEKVEKRHKIQEETFNLASAAANIKELDKLLGVNIGVKLPEIQVDAETWYAWL
jgi:hypothetical protein